MWMNNNESSWKTNQIHTTESISWFNSLSILINGTGLNDELILSDIHIHLHLKSAIFDRVILKNTAFHPNAKCERTIDITNNYNYQESKHIRFDSMIIIKLINPWFMTHWLTIKHMIEWLNGESNLISNPSQSDSIHSSFIAVFYQFSSIFSMQWSIPIQWGKINILFQYQLL